MSRQLVVAFELGVTPGKWARAWNERMPRTPLELRPASALEALDGLRSAVLDAAFLRDHSPAPELVFIELYRERAVVVVPKDHVIEALDAVALDDLRGETMLEPADAAAAIELVAANVGVVVLPQAVARALSRRDVVARPLTDAPETVVSLVWARDRQTEEVEELIGVVRGRTANSSRGAVEAPVKKLSASQKAAAKKARRAGR